MHGENSGDELHDSMTIHVHEITGLSEEALQDKLAADHAGEPEAAWMKGFGGMAHRRRENRRIQKQVDAEFGQIEAEDLA